MKHFLLTTAAATLLGWNLALVVQGKPEAPPAPTAEVESRAAYLNRLLELGWTIADPEGNEIDRFLEDGEAPPAEVDENVI